MENLEILISKTIPLDTTEIPVTFTWERYGLRVQFPKGFLPSRHVNLDLKISTLSKAKYLFQGDKYEPVSALYSVSAAGYTQFLEPIVVDIQHCSAPEMCDKLVFLCLQECGKHKRLKPVKNGSFDKKCGYGRLVTLKFLWFMIAVKRDSVETSCQLWAHALLISESMTTTRKMQFVITKALKAYLTVSINHLIIIAYMV